MISEIQAFPATLCGRDSMKYRRTKHFGSLRNLQSAEAARLLTSNMKVPLDAKTALKNEGLSQKQRRSRYFTC
jgi:hypothetical protein